MSDTPNDRTDSLERLLEVMARLRDPEGGCPWDIEQSYETIAPYTIEEAYEVADAIERRDFEGLKEELGDLLLQVVYHARMAEEEERFDFAAVAAAIADKMIRRHPHVFGDQSVESAATQTLAWEEQKAEERAAKRGANGESEPASVLDGVPLGLPALTRAEKLQKRATRIRFDWRQAVRVFEKIDEELSEIKEEIDGGNRPEKLQEEVGDLLFTVVNLARHLGADPETALRGCNAKFERRLRWIERDYAARDENPAEAPLDELEAAWQQAKRAEG